MKGVLQNIPSPIIKKSDRPMSQPSKAMLRSIRQHHVAVDALVKIAQLPNSALSSSALEIDIFEIERILLLSKRGILNR